MLRTRTASRAAAALLAAVFVVLTVACGGDGGPSKPSPSPDGSVTAVPTATPGDGKVTPGLIDLAQVKPLLKVTAKNGGDLTSGSHSLVIGDFNNDAEGDLLIGAPNADGPANERTDAGEAYVVFGPLSGDLDLAKETPDVTILGALPGDNLGHSARAGDLNGDGVDDILVGAPGVTAGFDPRTDQGRVYVFYGGDGLEDVYDLSNDVYDFTITGAEGFSRLGQSMALGDVNGDKANDLVVSAPFAGRKAGSPPGSPRTYVGEVYVVFGSRDLSGEANVAALEQDVLISGAQERAEFGTAVGVTDLNGDGKADIIVGERLGSPDQQRAGSGAAYVFKGRGTWDKRLSTGDDGQDGTIVGARASTQFGFPIATGDFNGDGKGDVAIGAQLDGNEDIESSGIARIFFGPAALRDIDLAKDNVDVTIQGADVAGLVPSALAAADLDSDGASELIIGAMLAGRADGRRSAGLVHTVRGGKGLKAMVDLGDTATGLTAIGATEDGKLGATVTAARLNANRAAVIAVAPGKAESAPGVVYVIEVEVQ